MNDLDFAARYPFTKEAREAIADLEITEEIAAKAIGILLEALSGGLKEKVLINDIEKKEWIATYAFARMVLGAMRNRYLIGKFAVAISKLARKKLNEETDENIEKIMREFGITVTEDNYIAIPQYLKFTPRDRHYALITRQIRSGFVKIKDEEKKRIIEEAIRKHVEEVPVLKNPPDIVQKAIEELERQMPKFEERKSVALTPDDYPPCVSYLVDEIKKHHNLPHHARWFLAVYLINIGLSDEEIVSLYSNLPDFSEKITRYQVTHARKRKYKVPVCSSLVSLGLCRANCWIKTPLAWRRKK